jgi:uncharacterized protein (TIGR02265 family)
VLPDRGRHSLPSLSKARLSRVRALPTSMSLTARSLLPAPPPSAFSHFSEPPWDAPLRVEETLLKIPEHAQISGMFPLALVQEAVRRGITLQSSRPRYLPFTFYPLREHVRCMLEMTPVLFPRKPLRLALRSMGRAAPAALLASTLGRVTLGAAEGPHAAVAAIAKTYEVNLKPGRAQMVAGAEKYAVVELSDVYHFADSHHVGVFEGALRHVGARGRAYIHVVSATQVSLLLTWE